MTTHLKRHHPHLLRPPLSSASSSIRELLKKQAEKENAAVCSPSFKRQVDDLIAQFIISNALPCNIADSPQFIRLLNFASSASGSYLPPARTKLTDLVDSQYQRMIDVIFTDIQANTISLTSDAGQLDNGHSYTPSPPTTSLTTGSCETLSSSSPAW
jgi:hypothetical protein